MRQDDGDGSESTERLNPGEALLARLGDTIALDRPFDR
jgi:hypothetical protein